MEARTWAWILSVLVLIAAMVLRPLAASQVLITYSLFGMLAAGFFLFGFALSPDARPPRIPPRTHTARTGLMPLGFIALNATVFLLLGHETLSSYVAPEFLIVVVFGTSVWLLAAFAARRHDSHRIRPETSYDVLLREYHKTENESENMA